MCTRATGGFELSYIPAGDLESVRSRAGRRFEIQRSLVQFQRAGGAGASLLRADRTRRNADADRRKAGQSYTRNGGYRRDQDGNSSNDRISDVAASSLQA
jgi:hypothetical protein